MTAEHRSSQPCPLSRRRLFSPTLPSHTLVSLFLTLTLICGYSVGSMRSAEAHPPESKTLHLPVRSDGPKSLDPVRGSTTYDNMVTCNFYDTLLQYKYLKRPLELEPQLLAEMPKRSEDGRTYSFTLKQGIKFHDDPCFPDGKGRELVAEDVFYSWKRMADKSNLPKSWWLFKDTILGFDAYRETQNKAAATAGGKFDYDAPVEGFRLLGKYQFEVVLNEPVFRFTWILAMFQTSVVAKEAVEKYGDRLSRHPVGTGPYVLRKESDWVSGKSMTMYKNPSYREDYYPTEHMPEDEARGLHLDAGKRLPLVDRVEFGFFLKDEPMWLEFLSTSIGYTQVPAEVWPDAFMRRSKKLKKNFRKKGVVAYREPLLDFIFYGFNMEDGLLGGYGDKRKYLRQAISLALDWEERNNAFYNGLNIIYDGPIPPQLSGHPEGGNAAKNYRGLNLDKSRELLEKAGYPGGEGLPVIEYYSSAEANGPEQAEMLKRHLAKIGIKLNTHLLPFSTLIEAINNKKAPFFSFAWSSDYPDGENNLALFYGPNETPGSNHYNYKNKEYDELYRKILVMAPSPERTRIYERMRDIVIEDAPYAGSMARERYYLINPWLKNFRPTESFYNWVKYLDVDESKTR